MDLKDLLKRIEQLEQYDGDVKQMEVDQRFEKFPTLEDAMFDSKEELHKLAKVGEDKEQNPLAFYSTTQLKKELRRRKRASK